MKSGKLKTSSTGQLQNSLGWPQRALYMLSADLQQCNGAVLDLKTRTVIVVEGCQHLKRI